MCLETKNNINWNFNKIVYLTNYLYAHSLQKKLVYLFIGKLVFNEISSFNLLIIPLFFNIKIQTIIYNICTISYCNVTT